MKHDYSNWSVAEKHIEREILFTDFREAISAMVRISYYAEEMNHHPEWFNVYNRLLIKLTTHDTGGISEKDWQLAKIIDKMYP